jgi:hypothetical protein
VRFDVSFNRKFTSTRQVFEVCVTLQNNTGSKVVSSLLPKMVEHKDVFTRLK